jgi:hypothetical protein
MRHLKFRLDQKAKAQAGGPRAFSTAGLLDESWFARVGWSGNGRGNKAEYDYLVFDDKTFYAILATSKQGFGGVYKPGSRKYKLMAYKADSDQDKKGKKKRKRGKKQAFKWSKRVGLRIVAMLAAGDKLFAAGTPDTVAKDDPWASYEGRAGGVLHVYAAADGTKLADIKLASPPVYDGMSACAGRLYISTQDGKILCLGK